MTMSLYDQRALDALRRAVAEALDRKRRLGQYAVVWHDGRAVRIEPAPQPPVGSKADGDRDE
jgi:hypothetical protein